MHKVCFSQIKVPDGKLLQLEKKNGRFSITGDFFCYPEKIIKDMEEVLNSESEDKKEKLGGIFDNTENTIVGFSVENLWELYGKLSQKSKVNNLKSKI